MDHKILYGTRVNKQTTSSFKHSLNPLFIKNVSLQIKARGGNQDALELDAYIDLYTQLLDEKLQQ
jgi:hypothetical protein